jgi:2-hydroxy-3-keto-5-methylthiopentenyl-1-phosphate phosphatase
MIVFVDFDGTITDVDTFDALVRDAAGDATWNAIDGELLAGKITLRSALEQQAASVRYTKSQALAFLEANANVDPAFALFVAAARSHGVAVRVVSSGIATVIHHALERAGVDVPVLANDVDFSPSGWTMSFVDASANGHDKAAHVRAARAAGEVTVYIGDGISDFEAALVADRRFAKKNRTLEAYCRERGVACTGFTSFAEIERALFAPGRRGALTD